MKADFASFLKTRVLCNSCHEPTAIYNHQITFANWCQKMHDIDYCFSILHGLWFALQCPLLKSYHLNRQHNHIGEEMRILVPSTFTSRNTRHKDMKLIYQGHSSAVKPSHPLPICQHCDIILSGGQAIFKLLYQVNSSLVRTLPIHKLLHQGGWELGSAPKYCEMLTHKASSSV